MQSWAPEWLLPSLGAPRLLSCLLSALGKFPPVLKEQDLCLSVPILAWRGLAAGTGCRLKRN